MGDATPPPPRPRTAYVQPTKRSSAATKSTKLKDISNAKVPTTDAAAKKPVAGAARRARSFNKFTVKLNEGNTNLLKQVSSQWIMGKGRSQTSKCLFAIRICLDNGIPPDDIASYVANGLETDVQAMERELVNVQNALASPRRNRNRLRGISVLYREINEC